MPTLHWLTRDEDIGAGSALTSQTRLRGDCGTMARAIEPLMPVTQAQVDILQHRPNPVARTPGTDQGG